MSAIHQTSLAETDPQNEALYQICVSELKQKTPEYKDLNNLIAKVMAGFTSEFFVSCPFTILTNSYLAIVSPCEPALRRPLTLQPRCLEF